MRTRKEITNNISYCTTSSKVEEIMMENQRLIIELLLDIREQNEETNLHLNTIKTVI